MPILGTLGSGSVSSFGARNTVAGGSSFYSSSYGKGLSLSPSANFAYGTGNFTVEMWIYPQDIGYYRILWAQTYTYNRRAPWYFLIYLDPGARQLVLSMNPGVVVHPTSISLNAWTHVAVVRQSNIVKLYVNGFGTAGATIASNLSDATVPPTVGNYSLFYQNDNQGFNGYLTNVRVAKSAIYTADFIPSRQPFTKTSQGATNVQLLLNHQTSARLLTDSSANALTVTNIGTVAFNNFSPYGQPYVNPTPVVIMSAAVTSDVSVVNEGSTVTFSIVGTNTANGTYYYTLEESGGGTGPLTAADFSPAALSGSFTITSGSGSIPITVASDRITEGDDSFTLFVRSVSITGSIIGNSTVIDIPDTSLTPAFTVTPASINEGVAGSFTVNNLGPAGTYYWTVLNGTSATVDFSAVSGSFTTSTLNGNGSFTITPAADSLTEGAETFQVQVRSVSITGTVIVTSSAVTVNDVSLTPQVTLVSTAGAGSVTTPVGYNTVTVEAIGGGGGGFGSGISSQNAGGGGGSYAKSEPIAVTSGTTIVYYNVGASATDSWVNVSANSAPSAPTTGSLAKAGSNAANSSSGLGGTIDASIGIVKFAGGDGGRGGSGTPNGGGGAGDSGNGTTVPAGSATVGTGGTGTNIIGGTGGTSGSTTGTQPGGGGYATGSGLQANGGAGIVRIVFTTTGPGSPGIFDNSIYAMAQQSNDKILVGGAFASFSTPISFFSVAAQETKPSGVFFKPDGTKMYVVGNGGFGSGWRGVFEYDLSSAWTVSTASFLQRLIVDSQELTPTGLFFKDDGTKMYVVGSHGDAVVEYNLSSAWNVSTASFLQTFSVAAQETSSQGLFFKPDGTKMYVVGGTGDDVNEYNLSSAWNISTASFLQTFLVLNQFGNSYNPLEVFFKPDGTKLYVVDSLVDAVNEYNLSSAWNVSTASFLQTFSVAAQEMNPTGLFFKPDGTKMYVVGQRFDVYEYDLSSAWNVSTASFLQPISRFMRLNADGTRDGGFDLGTGMFDAPIYAIAIQADGKILVGGEYSQFNGVTRNRLVRLNANGTEDTAFNNNLGTGFLWDANYDPGTVQTICIQSDGKILVGGYFQFVNGVFNSPSNLARLNADGTPDNTFGLNLGYLNSTVNAIAVQSNGLIVIGGFFTYVHSGQSVNQRLGIAWLNSIGDQQDAPYLAIPNRRQGSIYAISAQPDGKILLGSSATATFSNPPRNRLVRLNADGTEDTAFSTNLGTAFNNIVRTIALQPDGKILVGGEFTTFNGNTRNRLVRLNANGTEDTAFSTNLGTAFNNIVRAIALQSDGKILVGGQFTQYNGTSQNYIARLTSSGLIS